MYTYMVCNFCWRKWGEKKIYIHLLSFPKGHIERMDELENNEFGYFREWVKRIEEGVTLL